MPGLVAAPCDLDDPVVAVNAELYKKKCTTAPRFCLPKGPWKPRVLYLPMCRNRRCEGLNLGIPAGCPMPTNLAEIKKLWK